MAEEVTTGTAATAQPDLTNLKAEMDRKLTNIQDTLKQTTEALKQQLISMKPAANPQPINVKPFRDEFYEDEEAAIGKKVAEGEKRILAAIEDRTKKAETINALYREYPELQDEESPLTKKALELLKAYPDQTPASYRASVLEAAVTLDVLPKSKRSKESVDEYTGGGNDRGNGGKGKEPEVDLAFAERMGLDVKDEKVLARLKARAGSRDSWTKYR